MLAFNYAVPRRTARTHLCIPMRAQGGANRQKKMTTNEWNATAATVIRIHVTFAPHCRSAGKLKNAAHRISTFYFRCDSSRLKTFGDFFSVSLDLARQSTRQSRAHPNAMERIDHFSLFIFISLHHFVVSTRTRFDFSFQTLQICPKWEISHVNGWGPKWEMRICAFSFRCVVSCYSFVVCISEMISRSVSNPNYYELRESGEM